MKFKKEDYETIKELGQKYYGLDIFPEFIDKWYDVFWDAFPAEEGYKYSFKGEVEEKAIFDTAARDCFSDALARILTDGEYNSWPINSDGPEYFQKFIVSFKNGIDKEEGIEISV